MDKETVIWYQNEDLNDTESSDDHKFDLRLIEKVNSENNLFRLIVASLCPQIYGQHLVKSGLVLALFGGTHKHDRETKVLSVRAQIHILLFGDYGSKKDLLLKAVHSMAPKAQYVCGNTSKLNCLTTSAKKTRNEENFQKGCLESKEFAICCVDEFERMDVSQHQVIEEVMKFQTFTHNSGPIYEEVRANTAIIAAVNPLNGYYDGFSNVWQNTTLSKPLLSNFDLIFILVDIPNKEMDSKLSKEILESRKYEDNDKCIPKMNMFSQTTNCQTTDCRLMTKLNVRPEEEELDLIPHDLLKQYISYAQRFVSPALNCEAIQLLEEFYTEFETTLISNSHRKDIETLYRLTEARARVDLRSEATKEDVLDVIDIVRYSVGKHYKTPNVVHSLNTKLSFKTSKKSQNTKNLMKALKVICEQKQQKVFTFEEIVEICYQFEIPFDSKDEISVAVERLNEGSLLLKTNPNSYKLID